MLDGFLRSGRGRTSRAVWVPPGGGGGALPTGAGANEPVGMTQVFSQPFTAMPPNFPTQDAHGFTVNSGQGRLAIMTDGVNSWLRGTIPADHCHAGSSVWQFFAAGATSGNLGPVATNPWPLNTGKLYSRQWVRLSANYRMDGSVNNKSWSPRLTAAAVSNNFVLYNRGMAGNAPGDQKAVAPAGEEQTLSHSILIQAGGAVGSQSFEQSGATWGTSEKRWQSNNEQWHEMEVLIEPGTPGGADWTWSFWVDGLLVWQRTNIPVNNVGDGNHVGELNIFHQYNPTVSPTCTILNSLNNDGLAPGLADQWFDYGYWYASVEPV